MARLVSRLSFIAKASDQAVAVAIQDTAAFILTLVRLYAPVDTGWLRDSYRKETITPLHLLIGSSVNYSLFQEYGTSKMRAQPHMTPAFHQGEPVFKKKLVDAVKFFGK